MMKITNVTELVVNTATVPENGKTDDGFAQELDKATDSKTETVKDDSVAAKEPADAEADAVQKAPGEKAEPEEEQPVSYTHLPIRKRWKKTMMRKLQTMVFGLRYPPRKNARK